MTIIQVLCYGAGAVCLGVALSLGMLTALSSRYGEGDTRERCLSAVTPLLLLALGLYLILKAFIT